MSQKDWDAIGLPDMTRDFKVPPLFMDKPAVRAAFLAGGTAAMFAYGQRFKELIKELSDSGDIKAFVDGLGENLTAVSVQIEGETNVMMMEHGIKPRQEEDETF